MTRLTVSELSLSHTGNHTPVRGVSFNTFELVCGVLNTVSRVELAPYQRLLGFCRPTIVIIIIASSSRAAQAAAGRKKLARSAMTKRRVGRIASAAWRRNMYSRPSAAGATLFLPAAQHLCSAALGARDSRILPHSKWENEEIPKQHHFCNGNEDFFLVSFCSSLVLRNSTRIIRN
jgi:hypothetical protein